MAQSLLQDDRGDGAAEFALVLPMLLLVIFGSIDVGRYAWAYNKAEKATQVGARWAVATDMVASGLYSYSFATQPSVPVPQGTVVPQSYFPGEVCQSNGSTASCSCASGGTCSFPLTANNTAFTNMVSRMAQIDPDIKAQNVVITYSWSGLGFAGDPNGPDVAPLTTVSLQNMKFAPITAYIFGGQVGLPKCAYTLTMESGSGTVAY